MATSQVIISAHVRRWMVENNVSQATLGKALGISQAQVSSRLRGVTRWNLDDLDCLVAAGVPVQLSSIGDLIMAEAMGVTP